MGNVDLHFRIIVRKFQLPGNIFFLEIQRFGYCQADPLFCISILLVVGQDGSDLLPKIGYEIVLLFIDLQKLASENIVGGGNQKVQFIGSSRIGQTGPEAGNRHQKPVVKYFCIVVLCRDPSGELVDQLVGSPIVQVQLFFQNIDLQ